MSDPRFSYFKTFLEVVRRKSFSRAAESLGITQGTVSNQIETLERFFNARLFTRTPEGVELTEEGEVALEAIENAVEAIERARDEISAMSREPSGKVRVSTSTVPGGYLIPGNIRQFRAEYPKVDVVIRVCDSREATEHVMNGEADVAIVGTDAFVRKRSLEVVPIASEELVLVVPPDHRLADRGTVSVEEIIGEDYVNREKGSGTREEVLKYLREHDLSFDDFNVVEELGSTEAVVTAVSQGTGISIVSEHAAKRAESSGLVKTVRLSDRPRRLFYAIKAESPLHPTATEVFWEFLLEEAELESP
ncbi:MAG: selenium metabolism-associated LysR family transcriptional regulator [Euryarchaeota archaeon]